MHGIPEHDSQATPIASILPTLVKEKLSEDCIYVAGSHKKLSINVKKSPSMPKHAGDQIVVMGDIKKEVRQSNVQKLFHNLDMKEAILSFHTLTRLL
jgi:hypothetical protein